MACDDWGSGRGRMDENTLNGHQKRFGADEALCSKASSCQCAMCAHVHAWTCMNAGTHAGTQASRHAGTQARSHARTQARTHARTHTTNARTQRTHACMQKHVCTYARLNIDTHTHTSNLSEVSWSRGPRCERSRTISNDLEHYRTTWLAIRWHNVRSSMVDHACLCVFS